MKKISSLLIWTCLSVVLMSCGGSNFTSVQKGDVSTTPVADDVTPFSGDSDADPTYISNHCASLQAHEATFYGMVKNLTNRASYQSLIETSTHCKSYNGWVEYRWGNWTYYQYEYYDGTQTCDFWSQQPMGVSVKFFNGHPRQATIAIDATGNGWAKRGGQGFPVRRMQFSGVIDCSSEDLVIRSNTPNGILEVLVEHGNGHKNDFDMRARVSFNGSLLGIQQLRRAQ